MTVKSFYDLSVDQVRDYIEKHKEREYALIDVRQPEEYKDAHIPGGLLFPLPDIEGMMDSIPKDKELIVYCRSGNRSRVASTFITQSGKFDRPVYNLAGGILAWEGKTIADFPRFQLFDFSAGGSELMKTAIDLEKGASRFYKAASEYAGEGPVGRTFDAMAAEERAHARAIYKIWADEQENVETFDDLFASLEGEFVEGGENLSDMTARLKTLEGGFCLNAMELALDLEYKAFDLYRNLAEMNVASAGKMLMDLAQAEKTHMRRIMKALADC